MESRDQFLQEFRGPAIGAITNQSSADEVFQNKVIRPILKVQNELLIASYINYANKNKTDFFSLSPEKKMAVIENSIQKDIKFRNALKGTIIALFTLDEYNTYIQNSSNLNKRMMNLVIELLKNQVQLFELVTR